MGSLGPMMKPRELTVKASENNSVPYFAYVSEANFNTVRSASRQEQTIISIDVDGEAIRYCFLHHDDIDGTEVHLSKSLIDDKLKDGSIVSITAQDISQVPVAELINFSILSDHEVFERNKQIALNIVQSHDLPVTHGGHVAISVRDELEGNIDIVFALFAESHLKLFRFGENSKMNITRSRPRQASANQKRQESYTDHIAGMDDQVARVVSVVDVQLKSLKEFRKFGLKPSKGLLLVGPPGTGKTLLARTVANVSDAEFFHKNASEFFGQFAGSGEQQLRSMFDAAAKCKQAIIFIDEIDVITANRDHAQEDFTRRLVNQFLPLMDGLDENANTIIIGATNRPHIIDPAFRRPGRFDREILMQIPSASDRSEIYNLYLNRMGGFPSIDRMQLAEMSDGFVGADIEGLCKEVVLRHIENGTPISQTLFENVLGGFVCSRDRAFPRARKLKNIEVLAHNIEDAVRSKEEWEAGCDHIVELNALINDSFSSFESYLSQANTYYKGYELWITNAHHMDYRDFVKSLNLIAVSGFGIIRVRVITDDEKTQKLVLETAG